MRSCTMTLWDGSAAEPRTEHVDVDALVAAISDPDTLVWADVLAPTMSELSSLGERLGLHRLEIEDAVAPRERPKAAWHGERAAFVTYAVTPRADVARAMRLDDEQDDTAAASDGPNSARTSAEVDQLMDRVLEEGERGEFGQALYAHTRVSGFVFPSGLLTVRSDDRFDLDPVLSRWQDLGNVAELGPLGLVQGLLDVMVDQFFDAVQFLDDRIEDLEDDLFAGGRIAGFQRRAYALRKELVSLRGIVTPLHSVLDALWQRRPESAGTAARLEPLFADVTDHVLRAADWTESLQEMISAVFQTHLSLQDQGRNEVMKKLSGWAAVISVPTLVTGWFGVNVPYPGTDKPIGVLFAAVLVIVPATVLWWVLRRRGWL